MALFGKKDITKEALQSVLTEWDGQPETIESAIEIATQSEIETAVKAAVEAATAHCMQGVEELKADIGNQIATARQAMETEFAAKLAAAQEVTDAAVSERARAFLAQEGHSEQIPDVADEAEAPKMKSSGNPLTDRANEINQKFNLR